MSKGQTEDRTVSDRPPFEYIPDPDPLSDPEKEMRAHRRLASLRHFRKTAQSPKAQALLDEAIALGEAVVQGLRSLRDESKRSRDGEH